MLVDRIGVVAACLLGRLYGMNAHDALYRVQASHDCMPCEFAREMSSPCPALTAHRYLVKQVLELANIPFNGIIVRSQTDPETFGDQFWRQKRNTVDGINAPLEVIQPPVHLEAGVIANSLQDLSLALDPSFTTEFGSPTGGSLAQGSALSLSSVSVVGPAPKKERKNVTKLSDSTLGERTKSTKGLSALLSRLYKKSEERVHTPDDRPQLNRMKKSLVREHHILPSLDTEHLVGYPLALTSPTAAYPRYSKPHSRSNSIFRDPLGSLHTPDLIHSSRSRRGSHSSVGAKSPAVSVAGRAAAFSDASAALHSPNLPDNSDLFALHTHSQFGGSSRAASKAGSRRHSRSNALMRLAIGSLQTADEPSVEGLEGGSSHSHTPLPLRRKNSDDDESTPLSTARTAGSVHSGMFALDHGHNHHANNVKSQTPLSQSFQQRPRSRATSIISNAVYEEKLKHHREEQYEHVRKASYDGNFYKEHGSSDGGSSRAGSRQGSRHGSRRGSRVGSRVASRRNSSANHGGSNDEGLTPIAEGLSARLDSLLHMQPSKGTLTAAAMMVLEEDDVSGDALLRTQMSGEYLGIKSSITVTASADTFTGGDSVKSAGMSRKAPAQRRFISQTKPRGSSSKDSM